MSGVIIVLKRKIFANLTKDSSVTVIVVLLKERYLASTYSQGALAGHTVEISAKYQVSWEQKNNLDAFRKIV